eukprot:10305469-Alexandrium_andersonii.AAC.1
MRAKGDALEAGGICLAVPFMGAATGAADEEAEREGDRGRRASLETQASKEEADAKEQSRVEPRSQAT